MTELPAEVLRSPAMRRALAARDVAAVFRLLTEAGIAQRRIAELTGMGASEVSEVLAGRQVQSVAVLERIAAGLGVPRGWMGLAYAGDRAPTSPPAEEMDEDMKRRGFLAAASVALFNRPILGELLEIPARPETPTPLPSRLGAADVAALRGLTEMLRTASRTYGGQADTIIAVAGRSDRLLSIPASELTTRAMTSAVAELHIVAGRAAFDSRLDDSARYHFRQGLDLAASVDDTYWKATAIWSAARLTGERGHPGDALKLLQLAEIALADLPERHPWAPILAGWVRGESALALAQTGHTEQARRELARARQRLEDAAPDADSQATTDSIAALIELRLSDLDAAERSAVTAVRLRQGSTNRREAVSADITLATIHVRSGERHSSELAQRAIGGVAALPGSGLVRDRLAPLEAALAARSDGDSRELVREARALRTGQQL